MDYRILGPLAVYDEERRAVQLGGRQQRLVFAALLLHRNEVVSVDRLIDVVWGERAPTSAVKNVQVHVSRLRKALEFGGSEPQKEIVRTRANGYVLEVAPGERGRGPTGTRRRRSRAGRRASAGGACALARAATSRLRL